MRRATSSASPALTQHLDSRRAIERLQRPPACIRAKGPLESPSLEAIAIEASGKIEIDGRGKAGTISHHGESVGIAATRCDTSGVRDRCAFPPEGAPAPHLQWVWIADYLLPGPRRTARPLVGGAADTGLLFQGAMVSIMILIPANALSISSCTR